MVYFPRLFLESGFPRGCPATLPLRSKWSAGMQNNLMGTFRRVAGLWKHIPLGSGIEMVIPDTLNTPAEERFNSCIREKKITFTSKYREE